MYFKYNDFEQNIEIAVCNVRKLLYITRDTLDFKANSPLYNQNCWNLVSFHILNKVRPKMLEIFLGKIVLYYFLGFALLQSFSI